MDEPSSEGAVLSETTSRCPDCLERVPGRYVAAEETVRLARECPEHGQSERQVWGSVEHWEWVDELAGGPAPDPDPDGELAVDGDHACLAVIEVTEQCNLSCSFCFASSGPAGEHRSRETIDELLETVLAAGGGPRPIQLSGGEPTVRDDLPEIVADAGAKGFDHVQVNTNGLRLAREDGYAQQLADAGVTAVYLQFDGASEETYGQIRDASILQEKYEALAACRDADLPVVLVPTVVPGVNDDEMGDVVEVALAYDDVVESVNFQPVAQFGRYDDPGDRFSLDRAAAALAEQVEGLDERDLLPIPCCSSTCQMSTALKPDGDGGVTPLTRYLDEDLFASLSGMVDESDWMELLANTPAGSASACSAAGCCGGSEGGSDGTTGGGIDLDALPMDPGELLDDVLPVSLTGFMDAEAADDGKLTNCCVSVPTETGELVPFCAYNMTTDNGEYAIRERRGWGGRSVVSEGAAAAADATVAAAPGDEVSTDGGTTTPGSED